LLFKSDYYDECKAIINFGLKLPYILWLYCFSYAFCRHEFIKPFYSFCLHVRFLLFRLDQPYYHVKEDLLESLYCCSNIQTICFINKNGKAPRIPEVYLNLFNQVYNILVTVAKHIQQELNIVVEF